MAVLFANAGSDAELLIAGFIMVFFIQVAGNAMQILASEVLPTNGPRFGFRLGRWRWASRHRGNLPGDPVGEPLAKL